MALALLHKLKKSKLLFWLAMSPFFFGPVILVLRGEPWRALAALAFFGSMFAGIALGKPLARFLNRRVLKQPAEFYRRLSVGLSAVLFLAFPSLVASGTNTLLITEIEMYPLWLHLLWACFGGSLFFWLASVAPER